MLAPRNSRSSKCGTRRLAPKPRMSYIPSRAARWISSIVPRSNVADSRSISTPPRCPREVVEAARRAVAAELAGRGMWDGRAFEQLAQLDHVLGPHLLLHAVGPESCHRPAHVQAGLVD